MKQPSMFTLAFFLWASTVICGRTDDGSDQLQRALHSNYHGIIGPNLYWWTSDGEHLWHRRNLDAQHHVFVFIDARTGREIKTFSAPKLADALIKATGDNTLDPGDLPLSFLDFRNEHTLQFYCEGKDWECDLATYELHSIPLQNTVELVDQPERSDSGGEQITFGIINSTNKEVSIDWIDPEGARHNYAKVPSGGFLTENTYVGHFWAAYDDGGHFMAGARCPVYPAIFKINPRKMTSAPNQTFKDNCIARIQDHNIWLHFRSGQDYALSTDGTADDAYVEPLVLSPDGKHLAAFRVGAEHDRQLTLIESSPADQLQPKTHLLDYPKAGDPYAKRQVFLFDIAAKSVRKVPNDLFSDPMNLDDLRWRTLDEVTFMDEERGYQHNRLLGASLTRECRIIINESSDRGLDSDTYIDYLDQTREMLRLTELQDGWNHLYLYNYATGAVKNCVTPLPGYVDRIESVDEPKRQVLYWACGMEPGEDPYFLHLYRVGFDGKGLVNLTPGNFTHTAIFSPNGNYLLDVGSRVDAAPVTTLRDAKSGKHISELDPYDLTPLLAAGWRWPEPFVAKGRDGTTDIYGVIWRPDKFKPYQKYPVIEDVYAGPQGAYVPKAFEINDLNHRLSQAGFIVVQVDGMGTGHRSRSFETATYRDLGDAGFPDRMAWIRAAAKRHPEMDLARIGIFGTSAGGQNALRGILMWPDFYKACVSDCGCHDNRTDKRWWNERFMGLPVGPWYVEQSNVTQAYRLQGKLLLLVGEMDANVDPSSTLQVVNALIKAYKPFDFLLMPGQEHGVLRTSYGWEKTVRFFMRSLLNLDPK